MRAKQKKQQLWRGRGWRGSRAGQGGAGQGKLKYAFTIVLHFLPAPAVAVWFLPQLVWIGGLGSFGFVSHFFVFFTLRRISPLFCYVHKEKQQQMANGEWQMVNGKW